jgi:hypothetical protein
MGRIRKTGHNSALAIGSYAPTSRKIFTTFEINLASGFGCSASVSPIAKGAERQAVKKPHIAYNSSFKIASSPNFKHHIRHSF